MPVTKCSQETYTKKLQIEARVLGDLIVNHIVPTAIKFQNTLIENCRGLNDLFGQERMRDMCSAQLRMIEKISRYVDSLRKDVHDMIEERRVANQIQDVTERAEAYCSRVQPYMLKIREVSDKLEMLVDDELWPLPKYQGNAAEQIEYFCFNRTKYYICKKKCTFLK